MRLGHRLRGAFVLSDVVLSDVVLSDVVLSDGVVLSDVVLADGFETREDGKGVPTGGTGEAGGERCGHAGRGPGA